MDEFKMKDSGVEWIGEIPENWELRRVQYCLQEINVKNNTVQTSEVLSLVRDRGVMPYEEKGNQGNKAKEDVSEYKLAYPHTLVVNSMNILIGSVGLCDCFGCVSPVYYVFKDTDVADLRFINYIFNTRPFQKELRRHAKGILEIRLRVSADDIFKQKIALPAKGIQICIADFLDKKCAEIDGLANDIQAQIEDLELYKKSVISEAVTKGLNPDVGMKDSGTKWLGYIPVDWDISKIGDIYILRNTKVSDKDYQPLSVTINGVVPQLDTAAKTNAHDDRKLVKQGDFAINSRSDRRGSCGISDRDGSVSLINTILCPKNKMNHRYYNWLFHTTEFSDEFYANGHGIVDDLWTTGWQEMKRILIPLPPQSIQQKIADYLDAKCAEIDALIEGKKEQLEMLMEYKKSLIYEYVTGKKEVV